MYSEEFLKALGLDPAAFNVGWDKESNDSKIHAETDCSVQNENVTEHTSVSVDYFDGCDLEDQVQLKGDEESCSISTNGNNDTWFSSKPLKNIEKEKAPHICRDSCKHYDGVKDVNDGEFKEFCCHDGCRGIKMSGTCADFEDKDPTHVDGVLKF